MSTNTSMQGKVSFAETLGGLFDLLSSREKDVLTRRHGLVNGSKRKETLEKIGQDYKVTRERVRQIERDGIKKLKEKASGSGAGVALDDVEKAINQFLKKYGGVMEESHLIDSLIDFFGVSNQGLSDDDLDNHKKSLAFIITNLLSDKFEKMEGNENYHPSWKLKESPWELVEDVIDKLVQLIETNGKPVTADELFKSLKGQGFYNDFQEKFAKLLEMEKELVDLDEAILAYLRTSKKIKKNLFNNVGLSHWKTISPKRMNDKIYLVMKESGKPLHFNEIAELINKAGFDHKKALPATIHNELILDDRYVLIGRGIYALKEWGYQPGTVVDVISDLIKQSGPMTKDEIIESVSKQRMVKKATVNLALMNKDKFVKTADKKYDIKK
ncbi:MAG: sigma factor-like helix-turn-helix DNA-binding protein [Patescibacteria group bacterium]|jgi:hypothetical protein